MESQIPPDMSIDEFIDRVQHALVVSPYSHELRRLRQFATRHDDPEFAQVLGAKSRLFEQRQLEVRPRGSLGRTMYRIEKLLGGMSGMIGTRGGVVALLLAMIGASGGALMNIPLGTRASGTASAIAAKDSLQSSIRQEVLQILLDPSVQEYLLERPRQSVAAPRSTPKPNPKGGDLIAPIESRLDLLLGDPKLTDPDRQRLRQLFTEHAFAERLAELLASLAQTGPVDKGAGPQPGAGVAPRGPQP